MNLRIVTPKQTENFFIAWFECETITGNYVIQPGHIPTILILAANKPINFRLHTGKQESIIVRHGVIHVQRDSVLALIDIV